MGLLLSAVPNDGYTMSGSIPAFGSLPEVNFRYRPALPDAVYEFLRANRGTGKDEMRAVVDLLSKHLVSWDVREKEDGETVPVTADYLRRVPHRCQQRMIDLITGYAPDEQGKDVKN